MATQEPLTSFRGLFARISPTWLQGEFGAKYVQITVSLIGDMFQSLANLALMAPWTKLEFSPDDAVPLVAEGSNLPRYFTDTNVSFRARVNDRWPTWELAGTKQQLLDQLILMGFPNAQIFEAIQDWPLRPPTPYWSQFWVLIPATDHSFTAGALWDDGSLWDDGTLWSIGGTNATEIIGSIKTAMCLFKPGHVILREIIFESSAASWDSGHSWDDPGLVWGANGNIVVSGDC